MFRPYMVIFRPSLEEVFELLSASLGSHECLQKGSVCELLRYYKGYNG
jgi:hypothetical protein